MKWDNKIILISIRASQWTTLCKLIWTNQRRQVFVIFFKFSRLPYIHFLRSLIYVITFSFDDVVLSGWNDTIIMENHGKSSKGMKWWKASHGNIFEHCQLCHPTPWTRSLPGTIRYENGERGNTGDIRSLLGRRTNTRGTHVLCTLDSLPYSRDIENISRAWQL